MRPARYARNELGFLAPRQRPVPIGLLFSHLHLRRHRGTSPMPFIWLERARADWAAPPRRHRGTSPMPFRPPRRHRGTCCDLGASCCLASFSGPPIVTMSTVQGNSFVREDAPWLRGGPDVQYRYEQRVSFLCAGLDGPGRSFLEAKWPVRAVNVIDMKPYLRVPVDRLHGAGTLQAKDLMGMSLDDFESCDGLIAGPPCQAVSMFGKGPPQERRGPTLPSSRWQSSQ